MMWCEDWREADSALIAPLIQAEARRYHQDLGWDVGDAWRGLEPARAAGTVPGLICRDADGRIAGWTCFVVRQGTLQVAMLVAESPDVTRTLMEGVLESDEAEEATAWAINVREAAPGLGPILAEHGFEAAPYRYLARGLADLPPAAPGATEGARAWQPGDVGAFARLCDRAYRDDSGVRAFAPMGTPAEWVEYVAGLAAGGCGVVLPDASVVIPDERAGTLRAGLLATWLGEGTGHIAQLAVHPLTRGFGLGRSLVGDALAAMRMRGLDRVTLLVSSENAAAQRLYDGWGFRDVGAFVVGRNLQPRRLSSVAPEAVGVSTRR